MNYKQTKRTAILAECGIMLALAFVLSFARIIRFPMGGSVTLFSMLPICFISIKYGLGWGMMTSFTYSLLQLLQGIDVFSWGLTPGILVAAILLDYILAFSVLGLAGLFRKHGVTGIVLGIVLVMVLRFGSHFLSGYYLWTNVEEFVAFGKTFVGQPALYSLVYNGAYMSVELIMTAVAGGVLAKIPQTKKILGL